MTTARRIEMLLESRFGETVRVDPALPGLDLVESIVKHRVSRHYSNNAVSADLIRLVCACALSAPSKSDLQQRDIVAIDDPHLRQSIAALIPDMPWIGQAPAFLVFLANGRRLPEISRMREKPFPNGHFDLLFNAISDAAIALATAIVAAESLGLGCCPISVIRDHAERIGELLHLPERVIPLAGLCLGWPAETAGAPVPRLPLAMTLHRNRFDDSRMATALDAYDRRREELSPAARQRDADRFGVARHYGWSEDKARQYALPQRNGFGAYVRSRGFSMD